ncbi:hypothetical protein, partial [Prevotella sp.]|uniref:hypothetical protein n=1 Tax=Prevotella sp. TaxID=59823 RepID=UPI00257C4BAD
ECGITYIKPIPQGFICYLSFTGQQYYVINYDNRNVKGYYGKGIDTYYPCNNNLNFVVIYIRKINNKG